ncbi:MAG: YaiI/YqxD family protein [Candidatus Lernaella stagnicola]|nr:YaiI/YqxD family protein [Candidatus Lernaella stagnicola]
MQGRIPELYIDADACPVKNEIYKATEKYNVTVYVVCNSTMNVPIKTRIHLTVVDKGPDEADDWIVENVTEGDIVVTADIPLASRCIKKGARVLDNRGREFTEDSIGSALAARDLNEHLRMMGVIMTGPRPLEKKNRSEFVSKLHQVIQALMK